MKFFIALVFIAYFNLSEQNNGGHNKDIEEIGLSGHVVGGVEVSIVMYPFLAQVIKRGKFQCGGVIMSNRCIVTAAHCFTTETSGETVQLLNVTYYAIYLGSSYTSKGAKYKMNKIILHDLFDSPKYHDIAIVLLNKNIRFGSSVQKAQIAPNERWKNSKYTLTVAGYGVISSEYTLSDHLKATYMHYVDTKTCNESQPLYVDITDFHEHMFCMIGTGWSSDCFGDSGSAVIWRQYVVGIVTLGLTNFCGSDMVPSMYTNLVHLRSWIDETIKGLESTSGTSKSKRRKKKHYRIEANLQYEK